MRISSAGVANVNKQRAPPKTEFFVCVPVLRVIRKQMHKFKKSQTVWSFLVNEIVPRVTTVVLVRVLVLERTYEPTRHLCSC